MVVELTDALFAKEIQQKGLVVVDFWAQWCGPCKMLAPVIEKCSHEFKNVIFAKLNVDDYGDIAQEHGVMSIPCLIFFKSGKEVDRMIGFQDESIVRAKIQKHA